MTATKPISTSVPQAGFTLIEAVVALAILALTLGVMYESFGWSLRRTGLLRQQEVAWLTAQSVLAGFRSAETLRAGRSSGQTPDGLEWSSVVAAYRSPPDKPGAFKAFEVTIEVSWGRRPAQRVRLQSIETSRVST